MGTNAKACDDREACPECRARGKKVRPLTLESLLKPGAIARMGDAAYRFCATPHCGTVYFGSDGSVFGKNDLTVRVGVKATIAPRPVCYCFHHTIEEIETQMAATGETAVLDDIKTRLQDGCWCETTNPQGSCCLSVVAKCVNDAKAKFGHAKAKTMENTQAQDCCGHSMPANGEAEAAHSRRPGLWAAGGSVLSAVIASACCWLPLILVAFGVSAAGVSAAFEKVRPVFLAVCTILLAAGFYFLYIRREACASGSACAAPNPKLRRLNRKMLWVATALVLASALFPEYAGFVLGQTSSRAAQGNAADSRVVTLDIEGMSCEACAVSIQKALTGVPGVRTASVLFSERQARVWLAPTSGVPNAALIEAAQKAGYVAHVTSDAAPHK